MVKKFFFNVQKIKNMFGKSVQKTVLDRITPKVGPNPVSKTENGAARLFSGVPFGFLNEAKNVKKKHQKRSDI